MTFLEGTDFSEDRRKIQPMHFDWELFPSCSSYEFQSLKLSGKQPFQINGVYDTVDKITESLMYLEINPSLSFRVRIWVVFLIVALSKIRQGL